MESSAPIITNRRTSGRTIKRIYNTAVSTNIPKKTATATATRKRKITEVNTEFALQSSSAESIVYNNTVFRYVKTASFKYPTGPLRSVVLDNDETLGIFIKLRELLNTYNNEEEYIPFINRVTQELLNGEMSPLRPGIQKFLRTLHDMKKSGRINSVIMYTNMTVKPIFKGKNSTETHTRPEILSDIFDKIIENTDEPLIDLIIFRDIPYPPYKYFAVIEKIYKTEGQGNTYVFLDDKPENILNSETSIVPSVQSFGITEYKGRPTNKSFNNSYSAKGVDNMTVYQLFDKIFP